jgi:hypothetical protein
MPKYHFLRYGTAAEQRYMREFQHTYDCVAINGSMLAHISKGISVFMHRDLDKKFLVDPMTHSFQHRLDKIQNSAGEIKSSIKKLIDIYGTPISTFISRRPVRNDDFNRNNIPLFVRRVLDFQYVHLKENLDREYAEYVEYLSLYREPMLLIAPYFYMQKDTFNQWYELNLKLIEEAVRQKDAYKKNIFAQLVIDKKILGDKEKVRKIINDYSKADGLIYWIDGFDETEADIEELDAVKFLVGLYKKTYPTKQIISLYGGYFSELLLRLGLDGVVHGLEYGESRDVVPVGGGIPLSKYYLPAIRKRIPAATMLRLLKVLRVRTPAQFHSEICKCRVCRINVKKNIESDFNKFIKSKPDPVLIRYKKSGRIREVFYPERESKELCLFHYLEVKNDEFKAIKRDGINEQLLKLRHAHKKYNQYLPEATGHLINWTKALSA